MSAQIVVVTTGGTIAMQPESPAGGAVPSLTGEHFRALLPDSEQRIVFDEFANLPSSHLTIALLSDLIRRIERHLQSPDVAGVVLTHGTDTLEETAFLLDLVHTSPKPVVVTGAMRTANMIGYDGIANLMAAIGIAGAAAAREQGVLVAFIEQVFAASEVQKVHGRALNAFAAPNSGPLGATASGHPTFFHRVARRRTIPFKRLVEPVDLLTVTQASDDRLLRAAIDSGARGLVIAALGGGRVLPWWLPVIREARGHDLPIVIVSRTGPGELGDEYGYVGAYHDLRRLGCLFAPGLNGPKARMKLMLALGAVDSPGDLHQFFD